MDAGSVIDTSEAKRAAVVAGACIAHFFITNVLCDALSEMISPDAAVMARELHEPLSWQAVCRMAVEMGVDADMIGESYRTLDKLSLALLYMQTVKAAIDGKSITTKTGSASEESAGADVH